MCACTFPFRILGTDNIQNLFTIDKHTGQLFIKDTVALDVNHLKSENIFFSVEVKFGILLNIIWFEFCEYWFHTTLEMWFEFGRNLIKSLIFNVNFGHMILKNLMVFSFKMKFHFNKFSQRCFIFFFAIFVQCTFLCMIFTNENNVDKRKYQITHFYSHFQLKTHPTHFST